MLTGARRRKTAAPFVLCVRRLFALPDRIHRAPHTC